MVGNVFIVYGVCMFFSLLGVYSSNLRKKLDRDLVWVVGVGVVLSLGSFLLDVLFVRFVGDIYYLDEIFISLIYAYYMADADVFLNL